MGPPFVLVFMAVAAGAGFVFTFLICRHFLSAPVAIRYVFGFVVGGGIGAALSFGMLALLFGAAATRLRKTGLYA